MKTINLEQKTTNLIVYYMYTPMIEPGAVVLTCNGFTSALPRQIVYKFKLKDASKRLWV